MALPTAAAIQSLAIPGLTGTAEATRIESLVATADAVLAAQCFFPPATAGARSTLEATEYTLTLDGPARGRPWALRPGLRPITAVASVKQDTSGDWSYATTEDPSSYLLDGIAGEILAKPGSTLAWGSGTRYIQLVVTAGFDVGATEDLTLAIGFLIAHWLVVRKTPGFSNASQGGQSAGFDSKDIPIHVRQLVSPYRLVGFER